jgi:hypothetical protein
MNEDTTLRHPATTHLMGLFTYDHLTGDRRNISQKCAELASAMYNAIEDSPELTTGLRKLLEAKDCFVRAVGLNPA